MVEGLLTKSLQSICLIMKNKKISVVIPVFNNASTLQKLFSELINVENCLNEIDIDLEIIAIDDGSNDNSLNILLLTKESNPSLKVIQLTRNFGAVSCSKTGFKFVQGDAFVVIAADLQDPPHLILDMTKQWVNGSKFTICVRSSRADPFLSKLSSWIYYKLLKLFVIKNYPKGGFDIALMDKVFLAYLANSSKNTFTPFLSFWLGYEPSIIHYYRPARIAGKSGWTFSRKLSAFLDVMLSFSIVPIRSMLIVGGIVSFISFAYGFSVFINALLHKIPIEGFATIVSLLSFLLGLIILMLGIIGEYLWRIYDQSNYRPETVIKNMWL